MRRKKEFTAEQIEWFKANYEIAPINESRRYMKVGYDRIAELAEELGLKVKERKPLSTIKKKEKPKIYYDADAPGNYCIDCKYYRSEGICLKTGKEIGALWQKKCFKK